MPKLATKRLPLLVIAVVAVLLGIAPWTMLHHPSESPLPATAPASSVPTARVARETTPTIVESNANWLESTDSLEVDRYMNHVTPASLLAPPDNNLQSSLQR